MGKGHSFAHKNIAYPGFENFGLNYHAANVIGFYSNTKKKPRLLTGLFIDCAQQIIS
jgi:hypothetical protein